MSSYHDDQLVGLQRRSSMRDVGAIAKAPVVAVWKRYLETHAIAAPRIS